MMAQLGIAIMTSPNLSGFPGELAKGFYDVSPCEIIGTPDTFMFFGRYTVATLQPCDKSSYEYTIIINYHWHIRLVVRVICIL